MNYVLGGPRQLRLGQGDSEVGLPGAIHPSILITHHPAPGVLQASWSHHCTKQAAQTQLCPRTAEGRQTNSTIALP